MDPSARLTIVPPVTTVGDHVAGLLPYGAPPPVINSIPDDCKSADGKRDIGGCTYLFIYTLLKDIYEHFFFAKTFL